ncbi:hypothetical protein A2U01_0040415, partial [Trifolium medium]|nr:hypothetical protein [Trifolium medium]
WEIIVHHLHHRGKQWGTTTGNQQIQPHSQSANPTTFTINNIVFKEIKGSQFSGDNSQDPWEHLCHFQEVCAIQEVPEHVTEDQKKLRLFTYSLTKDAKDWLYCLGSGTIQTWKELEEKFLDRFFTYKQFQERKAAIVNFKQHAKESLYQGHQRFKLLRRRCPNHQICTT